MAEKEQCNCCAEAYNKAARRAVTCLYCSKSVCMQCVKTFLVMKDDPLCMMCSHPWSREFVDAVLPKVFRDNQYKSKREDVLFEREQAMLPATQAAAKAEAVRRRVVRECDDLRIKRRQLMQSIAQLNAEIACGEDCCWRLRNVATGVVTMTPDALDAFEHNAPRRYHALAAALSARTDNNLPSDASRRQFIKRCPADQCNGFLSTQYKCGMCGVRVCPDCLEIKCRDADHVCDANNVATARLIASECKVCPNPKCAALVYKVDGCDQMWCTQCHTAFSWRTGRVETGRVHNPHFYEWQRRVNNGNVPREPGDQPAGCQGDGGELNVPSLFTISMAKRSLPWVGQVHRLLQHILLHTIPRFQGTYDHTNNLDLRISYLLKEIDSDRMKKLLQQREKRRVKEAAIRDALEFFVASGADLLRVLARPETVQPSDVLAMFQELRVLTNTALDELSRRFSCKLYCIDAAWKINDNAMVPHQVV